MRILASIVLAVLLIAVLLMAVAEQPEFGRFDNPQNNYVTQRYIESGSEETGAMNIVTAIILDYRAFDTLGEAVVLFTGVVSVILVLKSFKEKKQE